MYPTHGEQQKQEIETIRKRTIELELSDADVKRLAEKAGAHGLTVGKLLENFIGDLVCGTYSNGSDERDFAERWFDRCWFSLPDMTFLNYLIEWGGIDEVLEAWDSIADSEESIKITQQELSSGVMQGRRGETYTWRDITNSDGTPSYSSVEEWEAEQRGYIEQEQDCLENDRETLSYYWNEYTEQKKEYQPGTLDEEMKKVLEWRQDYQRILETAPNNKYRHVIRIKPDVPENMLSELKGIADRAFCNRAGVVKSIGIEPYIVVYEGEEKDFGCLEVGMLSLKENNLFLRHVAAWEWVDMEPGESCDVLEVIKGKKESGQSENDTTGV